MWNPASQKKKFVIYSVFNYGAIDLALNLLESLRKLNIHEYHISYVTDQESYYLIKQKGFRVELFDQLQYNKNKNDFDSVDFNEISYGRYYVLKELITKYQHIWYLDTDIVVVKDIHQYFVDWIETTQLDYDIIFQNDINMHCTGCFLLKSSPRTETFPDIILDMKRNIGDQIILLEAIRKEKLNGWKIKLFRTDKFPNGLLYFSEWDKNEYMRKHQEDYRNMDEETREKNMYLVHANYMIGIDTKQEALKKRNLWYI
jgi:hypothetical protein